MAAGDGRPQILIVPEQHSHSMERQLCAIGGSRVSLFAEVLSFTRLANRVFSVYGGLAAPALDGGGRLLLLCAALRSVAPELRVYQRPSRKPAFLSGLLATVDELKTCRITPEQLWTAGEESGGGEGDKLRDLSLIYGAYEAMTARQGADPRDRLTRLAEALTREDWAVGKDFYLDAFTDFTPQERAVLSTLLGKANSVTVALTCDKLEEDEGGAGIFSPARRTARQLLRLAQERGVSREIEVRSGGAGPKTAALAHLEGQLFAPRPDPWAGEAEELTMLKANSPYSEVEWTAAEILRLVREEGYRFRDIAVCARSLEGCGSLVETIFARYGVPVFLSRMSDILQKPILALITSALDALGLDELRFVPAALPPHKRLPPDAPGPEARLEMVELAADGLLLPGRVSVSDMELSRPGKSYTADTLEQLHAQNPGAELWLMMGTDMFLTLQNWREPERITALAGICAFARTQADCGELLTIQAEHLRKTFGAKVCVLQLPQVVDVSSTRLRELLARGEGWEYLSPAVYGYILRHGLYGAGRDLKRLPDRELRACSYSMIRAKRIAHVKGTEEEAVRLARRWGADEEHARRAAILHDCTKYLELDEQLQLCAKYGIVLDELEQQAVKLLHSKTGACVARHVYGVSDDIYEAIFWHTTGKADMTLLEKLLYIADYMEPTRDFPGVERLRALAYEDLDAAVLLGCEMSIQEMAERGLPVHPNTVKARDWLRSKTKGTSD